jgi:hypothetical protein
VYEKFLEGGDRCLFEGTWFDVSKKKDLFRFYRQIPLRKIKIPSNRK